MKKIFISLATSFLMITAGQAQIVTNLSSDFNALVDSFVMTGVSVSNVQYTGDSSSIGSFSDDNTSNLDIDHGIILTTGTLTGSPAIGSPVSNFASTINSQPGDSLLDLLIPGYLTYDASVLEFDLVPVGSVLQFEFVFASEEYPEWVGSSFNDVFGFFISGPDTAGNYYNNMNVALIPGTITPVSINNVNSALNAGYFIDNELLGDSNFVFDGYTTTITVTVQVVPMSSYHLKMAIADAGDGFYDSGILLECPSLRSYMPTDIETANENTNVYPNPMRPNSVLTLNVLQAGPVRICIFDATGSVISTFNENVDTGTMQVPVGHLLNKLPSGVYYASILMADQQSVIKLVR
ncbi:MAG TPA: choice-of-anchor L domain-containing protein [Bacteroidales bacterium]|nr:choice-of-anchor L domain-containing protein [Bacteroidales bacterium]